MDNKKEFEQPSVVSDTVAELSKKLIEVNKKLKDSENERTKMIENISHDLRAPLTAIRSTVDYLMQKSHGQQIDITSEEIRSMLRLMDRRVRALETMVHDLYLLTCIDSGREEFKFKEIPFFQFLEEYYFSVEMDDKYEGYELVMDIPEDIDTLVKLDPEKMSRVLDNLFTNARKYSAVGSRITLGASQNGDMLSFYVEDTGSGIPEDAIPYVFDRTYRVSGARTPSEDSGSGLGLAISKSVVTAHDGEIKCESTLGKGSKFTVYLPKINNMDEANG